MPAMCAGIPIIVTIAHFLGFLLEKFRRFLGISRQESTKFASTAKKKSGSGAILRLIAGWLHNKPVSYAKYRLNITSVLGVQPQFLAQGGDMIRHAC